MPDDEEFRPGAHDLQTPFLFVPHGAPDPVEWKRQHPGWVSFPVTFVPHPRPISKWRIINGQRWPLDKRGRPWPKTRYGRPTCPFDELPPGMPAPGTQYELMRKLENPMLFFGDEPMPTVEEFSALAARLRAERAAAAPPPPVAPPRAYDGDGLGPVRDYMDAMRTVNQQLREFAAAARSRDATRTASQSNGSLNENYPLLSTINSSVDLDLTSPPNEGTPSGGEASASGIGPILSDSDGPTTHLPDGTPIVLAADRSRQHRPDSLFVPGMPTNQAFVRDTEKAFGALRDALGNLLGTLGSIVRKDSSDSNNTPLPEADSTESAPKPVYIDPNRYPESARHAEDAQGQGAPDTLTIDRAGAAARRRAAQQGTMPQSGSDRDEYPPAVAEQGGSGASVRPISPSDNRGAGASIGRQIQGVRDGGQIQIIIGPKP